MFESTIIATVISKRGWRKSQVISIVLLLYGVLACGNYASTGYKRSIVDVTNEKKYWGGYVPKDEYVVQQDFYILSPKGAQAELLVPALKNTFQELPNNVKIESPETADYLKSPERWPYLIGILEKGSRLRLEKIELFTTVENHQLIIHAQVLTGEFQGKDVTIQSLSLAPGEGIALAPNPKYLRPLPDRSTSLPSETRPH